jgi:hypothetical protein
MGKINFIHIPKNAGTSIKEICNRNREKLIYNGHNTDVHDKDIKNQLVIIRNPIDRFVSAVNYSLQKWAKASHVKCLIEKQIDTPEKWVQVWMNPEDDNYPYLMNMIKNDSHKIGTNLLEYKWTYAQQYFWINNPKFVLIMDNLNEEIQYLTKKYNMKCVIKNKNSTKKINHELSETSINFLREFYKEDFILYEKYQNMSIEERT